MRAVKAHGGVVRSFYVRQRNQTVGKPIEIIFGRRSAWQFAAEALAAALAFHCIAAGAVDNFLISLPAKYRSKINNKRVVRSQVFANEARKRAA
jgi:hypothetical protein